jgi:short-subunit dehydrogenase
MEIKNRHVLVTGASRGIGRAFANACAEDKAHLHLVLRKKDAELVEELNRAGAKSVTLWEADLSSRKSTEKLLESLNEQTIDILFNNAGVLTGGLLEEQSLEDIYTLLQVNVAAVMHLTYGLLPGMLKRKRGKIINNSSVASYMHFPGASTYSASKAAVTAFTDCLRLELKDTAISTLLLVTPRIKTRMHDEIETLYGKNFELPQDHPLSPLKYAQMIREAVIEDLEVLEPSGMTGLGLKVAKYVPQLFNFEVSRRFKR